MDQKICKNKKCQRPLPLEYKHKYCEHCRNKKAQQAKDLGKGVLGLAALCITIVSNNKIKLKK